MKAACSDNDQYYLRQKTSNGVLLLSERYPGSLSASIGITVRAGVTSETPTIGGISHFVEHLMFKGTKRRTARDLNRVLTAVGGELNAFTDREMTCFYAKVLDEHLPKAVDVLSDMLTGSLMTREAIELERRVILEEIGMYEDSPDELIHEMAAGQIFKGALGQRILGTSESVSSISRQDILDYVGGRYTVPNTVVAVAGSFNATRLMHRLENGFATYATAKPATVRIHKYPTLPARITRPTEQTHVMLCWRTFPYIDEDRFPLEVLNTCLGGNTASRLFSVIREKRGMAYAVFSYSRLLLEQGALFIYAGCDKQNAQKVLDLCRVELEKLAERGPHQQELNEARESMRGSIALMMESNQRRMLRLTTEELLLGKHVPLAESLEKIRAVTADDIKRVAQRVLADKACLVAIGPEVEKLL
jgi:predicted Zn-dependent peptidase